MDKFSSVGCRFVSGRRQTWSRRRCRSHIHFSVYVNASERRCTLWNV